MAVWQLDFNLIKEENMNYYNESLSWDENEIWLNWEREKIECESVIKLSKILPHEKSWSKQIIQYGKIDETCLEIFTINDGLFQISFRLDFRTIDNHLLLEIIDFIQKNKAIIVYDNKCYQSDKESVVKLIKQSNAYKFVKNQYEFLLNSKF